MKLRIFCILFTVVFAGCGNTDENLFCDLTLRTSLDDGRTVIRMEVDASLEGTYLRNVNNRMEYDFPLFINGQGSVQVQKGVYIISFDGEAILSDGRTVTVRSSEHTSAETAVELLGDAEEVVLNLTVIN